MARDPQPSGTARVAVVILNYRTPDLVLDCLETVVPEIDRGRDGVLVVDNASGDGSAQKIRLGIDARRLEAVRVIESPSNRGFAAGNNFGIQALDAQAYLLLNSDTLVRPGAIETLWQALEEDPARGVVSPRLEWPDGAPQISCFRDHSAWSELIASAATEPLTRALLRWNVPLPVRDEPFAPDWVSFAAVMIRRDTFGRVGLLDEEFFMYFEDADYCRRVREAGLGIWHEPRARVVHLRGGTSPVKSLSAARKRRPRYFYQSRSRYFRNAYGLSGWLAANLLWTIGRGVAVVRELLGHRKRHTAERQLLDIWTT